MKFEYNLKYSLKFLFIFFLKYNLSKYSVIYNFFFENIKIVVIIMKCDTFKPQFSDNFSKYLMILFIEILGHRSRHDFVSLKGMSFEKYFQRKILEKSLVFEKKF